MESREVCSRQKKSSTQCSGSRVRCFHIFGIDSAQNIPLDILSNEKKTVKGF
jgi:hypothetical protein